jgi:predicted RNA-binding Zn ribbon-like protein
MQVREPLPIAFANGTEEPRLAGVDVVRLRAAVSALLQAHVAKRATTANLIPLNRLLEAHLNLRYTLVAAQGRVGSARISTGPDGLPLLLSQICLAIVDFFASAKATRLKQCANDVCARFFLDESKSGTRTWCSMKTCGNRVKAARYYQRTKKR